MSEIKQNTISIDELKKLNAERIEKAKRELENDPAFFTAYFFRLARVEKSLIKLAEKFIDKGYEIYINSESASFKRYIYIYDRKTNKYGSIFFSEVPYHYQVNGSIDHVWFNHITMDIDMDFDEIIKGLRQPKHEKLDLMFLYSKGNSQIIKE